MAEPTDYADLEKRLRHAARLEPLQGFLAGDGSGALMRLPLMLESAADAIASLRRQIADEQDAQRSDNEEIASLAKELEEARETAARHIAHYGERAHLQGDAERGNELLRIAQEVRDLSRAPTTPARSE